MIRNKRRPKIITPSNSSFSNCVQDQIFLQPIRAPLETFKPVVYLDEQGRRHGRVSDHLLQRQINNDREKLKKQPVPRVPVSSTLYGIRNPNIASLIRDVPVENDDDDEEDEDDEIKFIEYKKSAKPATSKASNRRVSTISGKQSVKFDTTPSVNMARLLDSHLTELDDVNNVDDDDDDDGESNTSDDEELESTEHLSDGESAKVVQTEKSVDKFSETPSSSKMNQAETDEEKIDGIATNSTLEYNRSSQDIQMPPTVEDVHDDDIENNQSSPEIVQQNERYRSASSRPKTAVSSRSQTDNDQPKSSRATSTSTASDNTSALLRSDNDDENNSQNLSDNEFNDDQEQEPIQTPVKSEHTSSNVSEIVNIINEESMSPQPIENIPRHDIKGEYDVNQVIQLKESFQPIINEAASYGHLDIVRKLIEKGQSVHTQNLLQRTPLHEACVSGNEKLVSELLSSGALINQRDSQGMTALHVAAKHGSLKCIRILCEKGCDLNIQDSLGQTAAHYSAMHDHIDTFEYLVNIKHIDLSISNHTSKLPIHYAAKYGSKKILNFCFQSNLSILSTDNHGNLITHETSEYNQLECIQLIWRKNRNLFRIKNQSGRICLHTAALYGSTDVLHWLLELNHFDINQTDNDGYTMAHLAASRGQGECFSCLIIHAAQLDVYTHNRQESVFDIAKRSGKNSRIEQACLGKIRCHCCEDKFAKDSYDREHARNAVEQMIHTQLERGYHLNVPVNRSFTTLSQRNRPTN